MMRLVSERMSSAKIHGYVLPYLTGFANESFFPVKIRLVKCYFSTGNVTFKIGVWQKHYY
jgi:hypothetical protein